MTKSMIDNQPIGAVVMKADDVFARIIRRTSGNGSFNRVDWQFINLLNKKDKVFQTEVYTFLELFVKKERVNLVIERFERDNLIQIVGGAISITYKGKEVFQEVSTIQNQIKEKSIVGITEVEYNTTITTLQKIMYNVKEFIADE